MPAHQRDPDGPSVGSRSRPRASRLRRLGSGDAVSDYIRQGIISGRLKAGERLKQDEIADELGVSRIPVREAIIGLDREGWVTVEPNRRGVYVNGLHRPDIEDHYELRGIVFGLVALRAAAAAGPADIQVLKDLRKAMQSAPDAEEFGQSNDELLRYLVGLGASSRLRAALRVTPTIISDDFFLVVPGARAVQQKSIGGVVRAIAAADGDAADQAMRVALRRLGTLVVDLFASKGLFDHD